MSNNSQFKINNFSPNFRDALLLRNLVTDTVRNNSLTSWLDSINKPTDIGDGVGKVKGSEDIEVSGPIYQEKNIKFNKINEVDYYKKLNIPFNKIDIIFPNPGYGDYSTSPISSPTNDSEFWRETQNTIHNPFTLGGPQYYNKNIIEYKTVDITTNTDLVDKNIKKNPEADAEFRRDLNITQNKYKGYEYDYERISLQLLPFEVNTSLANINTSTNVYTPSLEYYTQNDVPANGAFQGGNIRQFTTAKNMYLDVAKQTRVDLNSQPMTTVQYTSYIDEFGSSKAIQLGNALGAILTGDGIGFDPNTGGIRPDFDIRSSLAGRALTSAGLLKDTRLGQISPQYLAAAIGNNIAFNLQEETLGRINTNPLSLLTGNNLIVPNYKITVRNGVGGTAADIIERITGAKVPVSLLPADSDIFSFGNRDYKGIENILRANQMINNTGKGQINALFANINSNLNPNLIGSKGRSLRQGYAPGFTDSDGNGINSNIYAFGNGNGGVKDFQTLLSDENTPIAQSSHNLGGLVSDSGFKQGPNYGIDNSSIKSISEGESDSKFTWSDTEFNKLPRNKNEKLNGTDFKEKKSILYKTQQLFKSGRMRTLVSGKGIIGDADSDEISTTQRGFMSKGSGVLKEGGAQTMNVVDMFARAWSPVHKYDQYKDLQKHSALSNEGRFDNVDVESSVLRENGIVQIGPYSDKGDIKRFMFSIENLAWHDLYETHLLPCEKGPGDPLTGRHGRIMWFPPYEIAFNESVSANWDKTNFIGRGEPIYTYNNTERTGNLSFKIVVDHPNYLNYMKGRSNDEIAAFFAGALSIKEIRNRVLNQVEKDKIEKAENKIEIETMSMNKTLSSSFTIYFPNDNNDVNYALESGYEDGIDGFGKKINPAENLDAALYSGLKVTTSNGGVGKSENYIDMTNFGLNAVGGTIGDKSYDGSLLKTNLLNDLTDFLEKDCKYCKFNITGYASEQGGGDNDANRALAKKRGENVKEWLKSKYNLDENRFNTIKAEVLVRTGCNSEVRPDSIECKEARQVRVDLKYDSSLEKKENNTVTVLDRNEPTNTIRIPWSKFFTECHYFESISEKSSSFYQKNIKEKIKNFHPAFHAITPEGFNSRLTFLHQCTRQGDTSALNVDNLAFGRAPVCILRIGDFYHTKIIIESLTIDYEPLVWDLNPEGVGVQPMIANINISFAFIGGSSMKGPINRLQNAVSFNFFANTELYDPRAERIKDNDIVPGTFPFNENILPQSDKKEGIPGKSETNIDQQFTVEVESKVIENTDQDKSIKQEDIFSVSPHSPFFEIYWEDGIITATYSNAHPSVNSLNKNYNAKLQYLSTGTESKWEDIATGIINGLDDDKPKGGALFTSKNKYKSSVMNEIASGNKFLSGNDKKVVQDITFRIIIPELNNSLIAYKVKGWLNISCPGLLYDTPYHLIESYDTKKINENPCCACYPDPHTKKVIILEKECALSGTTC